MRLAKGLLVLAACAACSSSKPAVVPDKNRDTLSDGLPAWVDASCAGAPVGALCAVGESDFATADVEAAKTDAETACKNRLSDQISAKVGRLTERLSSAMKDLTSGRTVGERTLKDINQNFQETTLRGVRYDEYFYYPSRVEPKKIYVRAYITVDSNKMSEDIVAAMLQGAMAEKLELKHEEAQARFDAVRKQYLLEEQQKTTPAAPAPAPAPAPTPAP